MALLRFVCRDLLRVFNNETQFIDHVAAFIESKALKPKEAEKPSSLGTSSRRSSSSG